MTLPHLFFSVGRLVHAKILKDAMEIQMAMKDYSVKFWNLYLRMQRRICFSVVLEILVFFFFIVFLTKYFVPSLNWDKLLWIPP